MILAAVGCLMAQVQGLAHLALVRHTTCAEHDALVHAATSEPPPAGAGLVRPRAAMSALPAEVAHEDDHCLAIGLGRKDLLASSPDGEPAARPASSAHAPGFVD